MRLDMECLVYRSQHTRYTAACTVKKPRGSSIYYTEECLTSFLIYENHVRRIVRLCFRFFFSHFRLSIVVLSSPSIISRTYHKLNY